MDWGLYEYRYLVENILLDLKTFAQSQRGTIKWEELLIKSGFWRAATYGCQCKLSTGPNTSLKYFLRV